MKFEDFFFIPGTRYTDVTTTPVAMVFNATLLADENNPPVCDCGLPRWRGLEPAQTIMDTSAHGERIKVLLRRHRYRCPNGVCGSYMHPLPAVEPRGRMTTRLRSYVAERVIHRPFSDLAVDTGLDRSSIRRIFDEITAPKVAAVHATAPRILGIDEFKLHRRYRCILTDVENRRPYDLLDAHNAATVVPRLRDIPEGVEAVVMDMSSNFRASVQAALPDAVIIADRFHQLKYVNGKLDEFRRDNRKAHRSDKTTKGVKDRRFLLMTRMTDLTDDQLQTLNEWFDAYPGMREVAEAKWRLEKVFFCPDRESAAAHLDAWMFGLTGCAAKAFAGVVRQFTAWREPILAYFDYRFTAGYTECMNGIIKDIDRRGRGLDWDVLRARFILSRDRPMIGNARRHTKVKARHPTRKATATRRRRPVVRRIKALEP